MMLRCLRQYVLLMGVKKWAWFKRRFQLRVAGVDARGVSLSGHPAQARVPLRESTPFRGAKGDLTLTPGHVTREPRKLNHDQFRRKHGAIRRRGRAHEMRFSKLSTSESIRLIIIGGVLGRGIGLRSGEDLLRQRFWRNPLGRATPRWKRKEPRSISPLQWLNYRLYDRHGQHNMTLHNIVMIIGR
jgi:hypothetical protein